MVDLYPCGSGLIAGVLLCSIVIPGALHFQAKRRHLIENLGNLPVSHWCPPGAPPGLFYNSAASFFEQLQRADDSEKDRGEWTEFRLGWDTFPAKCCGCLKETTRKALRLNFSELIQLDVSYCDSCDQIDRRRLRNRWLTGISILLALDGIVWFYGQPRSQDFFLFALVGTPIGLLIIAVICDRFLSAAKMRIVDFHRAVAKIRFRNSESKRLLRQHLFVESCKPVSKSFIASMASDSWSKFPKE